MRRPEAPRDDREADDERRGGEPRPVPRPGDEQRDGQDAAANRMPSRFVFTAPASSTAAAARRQPARSRSHRARSRAATTTRTSTSTSACGASSRSPKRGTTRTSRSGGHRSQAGTCRCSRPATAATVPATRSQNCTCRVTTSAPPIAWKAAASRIGCRGGYGRVRSRREDMLVEAVEEVDRVALRHPERPGVVLLEALQPRDPEEGLEEEAGERDPYGRHEHDRRARAAQAVWTAAPRSSPVPTPAAPRATSDTEISIPPKGRPTTRSTVQRTPNAATPSR